MTLLTKRKLMEGATSAAVKIVKRELFKDFSKKEIMQLEKILENSNNSHIKFKKLIYKLLLLYSI